MLYAILSLAFSKNYFITHKDNSISGEKRIFSELFSRNRLILSLKELLLS